MVRIEQLDKRFGSTPLLEKINFTLNEGCSASIMGPSGCGKSTLLNLLAGLDGPDAGRIQVNGTDLAAMSPSEADTYRSQQLGVVFQQFHLIDCLNVWDNIAFTARYKGNADKHHQQHLIQQLGLNGLERKPISQLSGGEQQRVAIARALNHKQSLVLADEPTGNLDEHTSENVSELLYQLCQSHNTSLIVVTHSNDVAAKANTRYHLANGKLHVTD